MINYCGINISKDSFSTAFSSRSSILSSSSFTVNLQDFINSEKSIPAIHPFWEIKGRYKISKKRSSHVRRIAWIMADCVRKYSSYFGNYYNKKRTERKTYKEAVTATSTKLLRTIYTLLTQNRLFTEVLFIHHSI